jgi:MFS transporter, DHA1 family, multidrug resistance protein
MAKQTLTKDSPWLLVVLAAIVAVGPLSIDMYLPAMPGMVDWFGSGTSQVQLTISSYLVGFAFFHLVCGPLADRFGRKPVLLGGLSLYFIAGVSCAQAETIEGLIFARFLQGVGACVGPTLGRAIARDLFPAKDAARALAYIAMIMALAPAAAPIAGGLLLQIYQWPAIFYVLAAYSLICMFLIITRLPESLPQRQSLHPLKIGRNYWRLLRDSHYVATVVSSSLLYAGIITFLSSSGFILIDMMAVPTDVFGLFFLPVVIGYITGNGLSTRLSSSRSSEQVMWIGAQLAVAAVATMLIATEFWFTPASVVLPMAGYSIACGLVVPHATASALRDYSHMAGTASALLGFIQMSLSSVGGAIVGILLADSARPMVLMMLILSLCSWSILKYLRRH